jgi:hypothetical protein
MSFTKKTISLAWASLLVLSLACSSGPTSPSESGVLPPPGLSAVAGVASIGSVAQEEPGLFEGACARSPGFYCQNQDGKNPNMTRSEFEMIAQKAAESLTAVPALDTADEVAGAVCNTGDQLLRHLATLALNLAAGAVSLDTPLTGESFRGVPVPTVGAAFELAIAVASGEMEASRGERNAIKDILDRINNNQNTDLESCEDDDGEGGGGGNGGGNGGGGGGNTNSQMTICHKGKNTLTIPASAWPAHQAHGDTIGACK